MIEFLLIFEVVIGFRGLFGVFVGFLMDIGLDIKGWFGFILLIVEILKVYFLLFFRFCVLYLFESLFMVLSLF